MKNGQIDEVWLLWVTYEADFPKLGEDMVLDGVYASSEILMQRLNYIKQNDVFLKSYEFHSYPIRFELPKGWGHSNENP